MDWSNERYVRLYTRDTETVLLQSWQARAVFRELLRKCDRAGVVACRRGIPVLAKILDMPVEVLEAHLPTLLDDGSVALCEEGYVLPNFIEAQEAPASDRQRAKEARERRRDRAHSPRPVTKRDAGVFHTPPAEVAAPVTNREQAPNPQSQNVTRESQNVTEASRHSAAANKTSLQPSKPSEPAKPATPRARAHAREDAAGDQTAPGDLIAETSRALCVAANLAIQARYGEQVRPLRPGHGHSVALTQAVLDAQIPPAFAVEAVRSLVATRSDPEPPGAMTWFARGITRLWGEEQARADAASGAAAGLGTARSVLRGGSFFDGLRAELAKAKGDPSA